MEGLQLVMAIADRDKTETVIEIFQECNVFTTDVVLGTGTAPLEILDYLYLSPNEKAVVFGVVTNAGLIPLLRISRKNFTFSSFSALFTVQVEYISLPPFLTYSDAFKIIFL